ncbi:hypothetical protein PVAP13_3NG273425 [Panicum virgatum]|uniref:Uncharacterized protein n=1 Tax=Panicum virgatum TaxID=38727 RepID=A0A8T0UC89_PANVG|nr:hypothetical protein PVAP13_3NG273425 [Panicum virgatum]
MVMAFCPRHGQSSYPCGNDGSTSPEYTPAMPPNSPTPAAPPEFLLRGMFAARRGAPRFSMIAGSSNNNAPATPPPPPPPAPSTAGRPTATAAANARPGHIIKTGHVPAETSGGGAARRPPPSGEGEA